jgi:transposase
MTRPGIGWVLAFTIAAEIGHRPLPDPPRAGRLHRAHAQGRAVGRARPPRAAARERARLPALGADRAAHTAARHPRYRPIRERMRARHGKKRGTKIAAIEIARRQTEAIWHMLTRNQPFAPAGATDPLAA